jgi:serine/threonine protein kinase/beta-lactam-binding protein with PASTA domain
MDTKVADPLHGALLGQRYRIMGWLARGGMATVYVARDERLERTVAVKLIHPDHARDGRFRQWLADEAHNVARLTHPNVVAVYDQGQYEDSPYLVMEYVRGQTLREIIEERRRLDAPQALAITEQILAALASAHRAGLVHRDVKPQNILVSLPPNGSGDLVDAVVKVADFGLAHAAHSGTDTGETQIIATAEYVAPETVTTSHADARSDVYSVGVVLFEMLTGNPPFAGQQAADVAWQHVDKDVPPPSWVALGLPTTVDSLVSSLTRRDPAGRPRDAAAALALVQTARDAVNTRAGTARALDHPTVVVPSLDRRPSWARLPASERPDRYSPDGDGWSASGIGRRVADAVDRARDLVLTARTRVETMRRSRRGRQQLLASLVAIGLVLLVSGWWFGVGRYTTAPALVRLTKANAVAEASRLGFQVTFGAGRYAEDVPIDTVLTQDPPAGGRILRGGSVTIVLSLGPERYPVPDVSGQAVDYATTRLKDHFAVQLVNGYSDTLPANYVVGTDPPAGTPLKPNSLVKVIVAKGPNPVHVPNVVGEQLNDAVAALEQLGFTVEVQQGDDQTKPRNQVVSQSPAAGVGMATTNGITIVITVAAGPPGPTMPNVVGARCSDAVDQLTALGVSVNANGNGFERFFWSVKAQVPDQGQPLTPGQTVTLQCG